LKRTLILVCAGVLAVALVAAAGCGSSGSGKSQQSSGNVTSLDEDVATGIVGAYVQAGGGNGSIAFLKDGTFEGNAWGPEKKGKYKVEKSTEPHNVVVLTFDGSSATETWQIGISMGKVAAVTSPDAVQYDKVVK
jgi:hypothetical protein